MVRLKNREERMARKAGRATRRPDITKPAPAAPVRAAAADGRKASDVVQPGPAAAPAPAELPATPAPLAPSSRRNFGEFEFLRRLTEASGVPGREERIRELVLAEAEGLFDETRIDAMGNLICLRRATRFERPRGRRAGGNEAGVDRPARVMLACHMDEIGFYVRHIDEDGHLRVVNVGGFDTRNLFARKVLVRGRRDLTGVMNPAGRPVHLASDEERKKIPEVKEFTVDLFLPKADVRKLVEVGDPVTLVQTTELVGDAIVGKAMDNRVSLWTAINAVRRVFGPVAAKPAGRKGAARPAVNGSYPGSRYDVYFVGCVQEEVGVRGAQTSAFSVDPDIGIAIDVTLACDTPGVGKDEAVTVFGGGAAIKVMDSYSISHRGLVDEFVAVARKKNIRYQLEILPRGGTDAGAVQRSRGGTRAITLSIPTRYIHTVTEAIHKQDARAAVDLLAGWLSA